ncbi:DUF3891 family protein [Thermoflavimicrobium daqui]|uniref:DUF3891 family protein n=1 Tax=Thermoflavimicrobium daqui TaxID=2137476 RepID=A0A364K9R6_9BACL|nr:DUF3891 family protein [Thermoflavimicrobium daqui]RAL27039.1 hypothetical protein DL897_03105 [Thermoflavimicrobium daqui]
MIVRQQEDHFILIPQHDHALVSGEFALHWNHEIVPRKETLYAISYHDVGWKKLDQSVLWDEKTNQPTDFSRYPLKEKIEAYQEGIKIVQSKEPYAGYLCSLHFASFFKNDQSELGMYFFQGELDRQHKLKQHFTRLEMQSMKENFALLQFCDHLSLAICLNEPKKNTHPWYKNGLMYQGVRYHWIWESDTCLRLEPNQFDSSFIIRIPYQVIDKNRQVVNEDVYIYKILA